MKFRGIVSIVQISSPHRNHSGTPARTAHISRPRRLSSSTTTTTTTTPTSPNTPSSATAAAADLSFLSRAVDTARHQRPCVCHEMLKTCLCRELTRTRDGVCDMCLYGIHVEEAGELFGDGYRAGLPDVVSKARRWTPPPSAAGVHKSTKSLDGSRRSAVMEKKDGSATVRGVAVAVPGRGSRRREKFMRPVGVVFAHGVPLDFDEHNMF